MKADHEIFDRYLEGRFTEEETESFDSKLKSDPTLRTAFAQYLALHGQLVVDAEELLADPEVKETSKGVFRGPALATAAAILIGVGVLIGQSTTPDPMPQEPVATLVDARAGKWGSGTLPTEPGTRLNPGRMKLVEGIATIKFDSGASISLEAPAELEVISPEKCRLIDGAAVAWVPDGAEGFKIETADALVTDYGTRFGITADSESGNSEVLVLEGEVGVDHHRDNLAEKRIKTGEMVRFDARQLLPGTENADSESARLSDVDARDGWRQIPAFKDTFIRGRKDKANLGGEPLVMVKNSTDFEGNRRKGYFGFRTAQLPDEFSEAEFSLSVQPSGMGYASVVPDAEFIVYGLLDESQDDWKERIIKWESAPANLVDHGYALDQTKVIELGRFQLDQGVNSGTRTVEGASVTDFLKSDTNGMVTLIVVRVTDETDRHGLVHAFASREHPSAPKPVLRVR